MYELPDLQQAKCRDEDPETKTPEVEGEPPRLADLMRREAVAGCAGCPELVRCMAYAESELYPFGAWGGRWWDGEPTDVAIDEAPTPRRRVRTTSRERIA